MPEHPILHVLVIGFHHKRGCQVEYAYPPFKDDTTGELNECPNDWKHLPSLALPDGSHNFDEDTSYFHLPSLKNPNETIYGISCYRQIPLEKIINRTPDMTRSTIQKSVCVLSKLPLYGHIQVKMSLITHAYFEEGDFSKITLLHDTYHHLNACLSSIENISTSPHLYVGLSAVELVTKFKHKVVLLFKLLLLERKVLFFYSPVRPLCSTILTLLSLHPGLIESGLKKSASIKPKQPNISTEDKEEDISISSQKVKNNGSNNIVSEKSSVIHYNTEEDVVNLNSFTSNIPRDPSIDSLSEAAMQYNMISIAQINSANCAVPMSIFDNGNICQPYSCLSYMDILTDASVRGYMIGASNILFKQKKNLADVIVEIDDGKVEIENVDLKRILHLTTEDLRFADYLVRHVVQPEKEDVFLDGVGWEGGDEWIRAQFKAYLLSLLRTSLLNEGAPELNHFNPTFISTWQQTKSYQIWLNEDHKAIIAIEPCHPFAGQLSVADMKLRISHTMQSSESGRKLNQAVQNTSRAVATTGKAVGGAISQAKGAVTNWWSNLTTAQDFENEEVQPPIQNV
ncbi:late secretory pathway protein AVL9 homolog [Daktulosphaira vitifoliae]|uniref:late secretory pathway protein AVL9 homolog n=1 Tax=Daktulosphaira vitifoliae TaxID=58002 RepID=UPI0021AA04B0|nr:late secretory pathway protein AVL9 homolog [Daktulosphaira vitifoliae]